MGQKAQGQALTQFFPRESIYQSLEYQAQISIRPTSDQLSMSQHHQPSHHFLHQHQPRLSLSLVIR